ncbi:hypothetical protein ACFQ1B_01060 [Streptomyces mexicanus]
MALAPTGVVPPFRPGTEVVYFGDTDHCFGWLCVVPYGTATGTVTVNGRKRSFTGHGYHDRNWGNRPFPYGVEHWRWGRGSVDPYAVIGADLHLREEYGSATVPAFLVDGTTSGRRLIGTYDPRTVTAGETDPRPHPDPAYPRNYRHPKRPYHRPRPFRVAFLRRPRHLPVRHRSVAVPRSAGGGAACMQKLSRRRAGRGRRPPCRARAGGTRARIPQSPAADTVAVHVLDEVLRGERHRPGPVDAARPLRRAAAPTAGPAVRGVERDFRCRAGRRPLGPPST